eukprot:5993944-Pyramimonas_sp.AAC.1
MVTNCLRIKWTGAAGALRSHDLLPVGAATSLPPWLAAPPTATGAKARRQRSRDLCVPEMARVDWCGQVVQRSRSSVQLPVKARLRMSPPEQAQRLREG